MISFKPALAALMLISGIATAYADEPMPNGTVSPMTRQQTNGYPGHMSPHRYHHMGYGMHSMYRAPPNGTVRYGMQTNGYPGHMMMHGMRHRMYGMNAMHPQPNGTVSPATGKQTNGY